MELTKAAGAERGRDYIADSEGSEVEKKKCIAKNLPCFGVFADEEES